MSERHSAYDNGFHLADAEPLVDLSTIVTPPPWTIDALCAQVDPELFFPEGKGKSNKDAKKVCGMCDVRPQCLEYADAYETGLYGTNTSYATTGVYGGLSPQQRIARRQRKAA